jgi:general secretion pathway protein D
MKKYFIYVFILLMFFSCAKQSLKKDRFIPKRTVKVTNAKHVTSKLDEQNNLKEKQSQAEKTKIISSGSIIKNVKKPVNKKVFYSKNGKEKHKVDLVFDNVDIYEVINTILGQELGENFLIDPSIKNKVSMKISGEFTRNQLMDILSKALEISGIAIIKDKKVYKIISSRNVSKNIYFGEISSDYVIDIIQLKHIASYQFVGSIKPFLTNSAVAIVVNSSNSIIIADKRENIESVKRILKVLDTSVFDGLYFKILKLKYLTAEEGVKLANNILRSNALFVKNGLLRNLFITYIKSNNSVLCISRDKELMDTVINWLLEADRPDEDTESKVYVVPVANVKTEDLTNILKQLYGGKATTTKKGKVIVRGTSFNSGTLSGEVTFIPDKVNNFIIIKATPQDYKIIENVLKQLDVIPRQVLIDVFIAEVSYSDKLSYGVEWYLKNHGVKINNRRYNGSATLNKGISPDSESSIIGSSLMGFTYAIFDRAGGLRGLINALEEVSKVNILASPSILSVDNQEAKIEIGEEVPTIAQSVTNTSSDNGNITNTVQYRKTGIILKVKPQINPKGLVRLDVEEEVSEPKSNTISGIDSPIFLNRSAKTSLVVFNNQTIVIGGLIKQKNDTTDTGVPILSSIPVVGYFFGSKQTTKEKTELIIAITPHIINTRDLTTYYSEEFVNKLNSIKGTLEKQREKTFNEIQIK